MGTGLKRGGLRGAERRSGSALMAVLWAVIVLSLSVSGWIYWMRERVLASAADSRGVEALAMARSGVAVAFHPNVKQDSSLLQGVVAEGMEYQVEMQSEGARLNLAWIFQGEDPRRVNLFKQWLEQTVGMDIATRDRVVACIQDYVDPDNNPRLNGQEDQGDYHPANRPLRSVEELMRIPGAAPLLDFPGWRQFFTLESTGPIDLMEAGEDLLRILPGMNEGALQRWVQLRAGLDQVLHTDDDPVFQSADQVRAALGMTKVQWENLAPLVTVKEPTIRIRSTGRSGKVVRQVEAVVRKGNAAPQLRAWIE